MSYLAKYSSSNQLVKGYTSFDATQGGPYGESTTLYDSYSSYHGTNTNGWHDFNGHWSFIPNSTAYNVIKNGFPKSFWGNGKTYLGLSGATSSSTSSSFSSSSQAWTAWGKSISFYGPMKTNLCTGTYKENKLLESPILSSGTESFTVECQGAQTNYATYIDSGKDFFWMMEWKFQFPYKFYTDATKANNAYFTVEISDNGSSSSDATSQFVIQFDQNGSSYDKMFGPYYTSTSQISLGGSNYFGDGYVNPKVVRVVAYRTTKANQFLGCHFGNITLHFYLKG